MRIMSITSHPDDMEFVCAGTLLKCKQRGDEIVVCVATNGSMGHYELPSPHLACIRRREARISAELLGAEIILIDLPDSGPWPTAEQMKLFCEAIREAQPDVILTHFPGDYMSDHYHTGQNAMNASFWASVPLYPTIARALDAVPAVYYCEPVGGLNGFRPTDYVDITDVWEIKAEMLRCHQSQYKWLLEHDNIDYVEFMATVARFRGLQCGVEYAEAFMAVPLWPRVRPERLLP